MRVDENWAIFVNPQGQVEWAFGKPDGEFLQFTVNFLQGLGNIAQEIFGENSVASIEFDLKKHSGFKPSEIFIVSLQNRFFFICVDPSSTLKLIKYTEGLPPAMEEQISAVLVGQASILFAYSISNAQNEKEKEDIEKNFQNIILDINPTLSKDEISTICSKASSNFSMLPFNELLLLHYYIRRTKSLTDQIVPTGWVLCSNLSGGELPFSWNVDSDVVLAGYLAVIIGYVETLFGGSKPRRLVFGTHEIRQLDFINGEDYFLVIDSPFTQLCEDPEYLPAFLSIPDHVFDDLKASLKNFLIREALDYALGTLEKSDVRTILKTYQSLSKDSVMTSKEKISKMWQNILSPY